MTMHHQVFTMTELCLRRLLRLLGAAVDPELFACDSTCYSDGRIFYADFSESRTLRLYILYCFRCPRTLQDFFFGRVMPPRWPCHWVRRPLRKQLLPRLGEPVVFDISRSVPGSDAPAMSFPVIPLPS